MSSIHFIGGEKGGVGKSLFARVFCQWFIDHAVKFAALDADLSRASLIRTYGAHAHPVDLSVFASADQIMDRALGAEREVVVDLPAQSLRWLERWMEASGIVDGAEEFGVRLVFWHVTDGGYESIQCLEQVQQLLGPTVQVNVVCNHGRSRDFAHLEASAPVERALESGGKVIQLPLLDPQVLYKIDALGCSLADATQKSHGEHSLTPMQERRAAMWLGRAYAELETVVQSPLPIEEPALEPPHDESATAPASKAEPAEAQSSHESIEGESAAPSSDATPAPKPRASQLSVGAVISDGATTWTEVGEGCLIHHVRVGGN